MKLRGTMSIDHRGHLLIGGCDTVELARQYGTPLYVIDEAALREKAREYRRAFHHYMPDSEVIYAGKALLTSAICRIIDEEQLSLDVVSGGELYTALAAGFPPERIYFHGNNKSPAELTMAVTKGVGRIVVDNLHELRLLQEIASIHGAEAKILLRITPGIKTNTHAYIQTGQFDSKFGFPLGSEETVAAVEWAARRMPNIRLMGLHCHIGSQVMDLMPFRLAAEHMLRFAAELRARMGLKLAELDLGGGLGIRYHEGDEPPTPAEYAQVICQTVTALCRELGLEVPKIMVEPGRSIVGEAGTTLYTVGAIKDVPNVRRYVAVDGGMADNPRVALYQAVYEACLANKAAEEAAEVVTIAGRCCESGDILVREVMLPPVEPGDILAVFSTGAYNYSMASNYNHLPRPAMVLVYEGKSDVIVERETYEDLIRLDRIPPRLAVSQDCAAGGSKSAAAAR